ncbi:hypothetical protein RYX36_007747 [Vicia faba]
MEIQFEEPKKSLRPKRSNKLFKGGSKKSETKNKFVGVRQRPSGRYVAEIKDTTQNIRMWLGTFEKAEEAAKAYDEAATLLRGSNTRTNFITHVSYDSPLAFRIKNLLKNREKGNEKQVEEDLDVRSSITSRVSTTNGNTNNINISSTMTRADMVNSITNSSGASCVTSTSTNTTDSVYMVSTGASSMTNTNITISTSSSKNNIGENSISSVTTIQNTRLFDDAYRPDMSNFNEYESSYNKSSVSWDFGPTFDNFPFDQRLDMSDELGVSEFERMKVERQISASLYAINGVHEYMENFQDCNEPLWNLSPFCSFLSSNNMHEV